MSESIHKANVNRAKKAKALHAKNTQIRAADAKSLKALYLAAKGDPILLDIVAKACSFISYHVKLAQDGTGARRTGHKLVDGTPEVENYFFTNDEIAGEMKKASGIQELLDYIERQTTLPEDNVQIKK